MSELAHVSRDLFQNNGDLGNREFERWIERAIEKDMDLDAAELSCSVSHSSTI